jgi:hypothetical protein
MWVSRVAGNRLPEEVTVHTWMYIVLGGNETPAKVAIRPVHVAQKVKIKIIFCLNFVYTVHHITFSDQ